MNKCCVYLDEADEEDVSPVCLLPSSRLFTLFRLFLRLFLLLRAPLSAHVGKNAMGGEKLAVGLAASLIVFLQLCWMNE